MTCIPNPNIGFADTPALDAFSRLRVSQNNILFTNEFLYDKRPLLWNENTTGSGSAVYNQNRASINLSVAGSGDSAFRRTKEYFKYLAGQSHLIICSFASMQPVPATLKAVGYFDDNDGIFLRSEGTTVSLVLRSNVTGTPIDTIITQNNWNLDPMDGSGASGIIVDFSRVQILIIDFQWLGAGRVRCGFDIGGKTYYVHEFLNANVISSVYMSRPSLPISYEISSSGGAASLEQICSTVCREGGNGDPGALVSVTTGLSPLTATTTLRSLLSVRLRASHIRGCLQPLAVDVFAETNGIFDWRLLLNPTLSGALTYSDAGIGLQVSTTQETVTPNTGLLLSAGHFERSGSQDGKKATLQTINDIKILADRAGVADQLILAIATDSGTDQVEAAMKILESY